MYNKQFTIGHFTNSYLQGVKMVKINVDEYVLCTGYKLVRKQNTLDYYALHQVPDTQKWQPAKITHRA